MTGFGIAAMNYYEYKTSGRDKGYRASSFTLELLLVTVVLSVGSGKSIPASPFGISNHRVVSDSSNPISSQPLSGALPATGMPRVIPSNLTRNRLTIFELFQLSPLPFLAILMELKCRRMPCILIEQSKMKEEVFLVFAASSL